MDVRSLTQSEAEERAALLSVERYQIDLDLTGLPDGPEVRSRSTITFSCRQPGAATFVDCAAHVVSATLNGKEIGGRAEGGRLPLSNLAETNTLVVETVQADTATGEGVHRAVDPADKEVYVWTSFEPDQARFVWACFDQPDLKAPHAFTVTAPSAWTVVSNTGGPQVEDLGVGRRWTFPDTPPLSTYNPVVNAGPFHERRRETGGHDLGLFARRSLADILDRDADELFTVTAQGLEFFGRVFAMPFPQVKYDQVFMPEFGGAMENYGCVTWADSFLRRATPTPAENELFAKVLLHEMAHMWFGNIVTMRWWDDLWLNEAFAEFACHWAAVRATKYADAWASFLASEKLDAYLADQGPASHPIHQPIRDVAEATSVFDAITYPKGASVLHQLMTYVGEEAFSAGMSAYFAKHAWGNTTLQDLMDALAAASGRDLDPWRDGWLQRGGTDRLTLERDGDGHVLVARSPEGDPRPHVLAVGSYRKGSDGLERIDRSLVEVSGPRTPVDLPDGADLYLVNDDDLTFATTRVDAGSRATLLGHAAGLPSPMSRAVAVATVWDMLMNGEADASEVVDSVTAVLERETSDAIVEPLIITAWKAAEQWTPETERADVCRRVADTCFALAEDPAHRQVALRGVARTAVDEDSITRLREAVGSDVDLHWRALVRQAEIGAVPEDEIDRLLDSDPDPDAWVRALTVRAARPTEEDKAAVWQTLVADRKVPVSSVALVARAFWRPGQDQLTQPYIPQYLDLLPHLHESGMIGAMVYTHNLFPVFGSGEAFLDEATEAARDAAPVVRKTVVENVDELRRMLRSRNRDSRS
ncbi:MAG: aminopeptidase [Nocardioidaceae bacterium]|nr:aminopeptidase [Nocardioidaceae bacterium]